MMFNEPLRILKKPISLCFVLLFSPSLVASDIGTDTPMVAKASIFESHQLAKRDNEEDLRQMMQKMQFHGTVIIQNKSSKEATVKLLHEEQSQHTPSLVLCMGGIFNKLEDFFQSLDPTKSDSERLFDGDNQPRKFSMKPNSSITIHHYSPTGNRIKLSKKLFWNEVFLNVTDASPKAMLLSIENAAEAIFPRALPPFSFIPTCFSPIREMPEWAQQNPGKIIKLCPQYPPREDMSSAEFRQEFDSHLRTLAYIICPQEGISDIARLYEKRRQLFENAPIPQTITLKELSPKTKIPLITHTIWLTNPNKPIEFPDNYLKWLQQSIAVMPESDGWQHILWVQNKKILPLTTEKLRNTGVQIKEIYTDRHCKFIKDLPKFNSKKTFEMVMSQSRFGMASDILRLEILNQMGGLYKDTDYIIEQNPIVLMHMYDSLFGIEPMSTFLCNAFMACKPKHPITKTALRLIERNFDARVAPEYVLDIPQGDGYQTIAMTGPLVTMLAFYQGSGLDGNLDVAFPPEVLYPAKIRGLYPQKEIVKETDALPETSLGRHLWEGAWVKKTEKDDKYGSKG